MGARVRRAARDRLRRALAARAAVRDAPRACASRSPPEPSHVIDKNLALLRALGIEAEGHREFPLPPAARRAAPRRPSSSPRAAGATSRSSIPAAGGRASSGRPRRSAPWRRGSPRAGIAPVVTWGPGEEGLADAVVAASEGAATRCFPTTLLEYVELARRRARSWWPPTPGPCTSPAPSGRRWSASSGRPIPRATARSRADDLTVRRQPLCAPCHRRRCSIHEGVMAAIPPAEVLAAIDRRLAARRRRAARAPAG